VSSYDRDLIDQRPEILSDSNLAREIKRRIEIKREL
jgi:hypothetical protein